ncbi:MAG: hypothetical protein JNL42_15095 [Anaerolineae bacterium]|nr:hypothetical protein [Anaerolineae bacterium]
MRIRFSRSAEAALLAGKFGDGGKAITREFLARQAQNLDDEERAQFTGSLES